MLYLLIKWVHVLSDIVAFGSFITYSLWLYRANRTSHALVFTLNTIKFCEDKLANPAYVISVLTGFAMVFVGKWNLSSAWLQLSMGLYIASMILGVFFYVPVIRDQIALAQISGHHSTKYKLLAGKAAVISIATSVFVVGIVFLMVIKPRLWG